MKKIEYKSFNTKLTDNNLNELGSKGWDLVSHSVLYYRAELTQYYVFKRELIEEPKKYYRVCHKETLQGLWYDYKGEFTGLIHNDFNFCANNKLEMDFDPEIVGWLSATDSLETLWKWFTEDDIKQLQEHGWYIHEFEATDVKFYERFQHLIIKQDTSKVLRVIEL
jgi:hypothetical protein